MIDEESIKQVFMGGNISDKLYSSSSPVYIRLTRGGLYREEIPNKSLKIRLVVNSTWSYSYNTMRIEVSPEGSDKWYNTNVLICTVMYALANEMTHEGVLSGTYRIFTSPTEGKNYGIINESMEEQIGMMSGKSVGKLNKISLGSMIPGDIYINRKGQEFVYLGWIGSRDASIRNLVMRRLTKEQREFIGDDISKVFLPGYPKGIYIPWRRTSLDFGYSTRTRISSADGQYLEYSFFMAKRTSAGDYRVVTSLRKTGQFLLILEDYRNRSLHTTLDKFGITKTDITNFNLDISFFLESNPVEDTTMRETLGLMKGLRDQRDIIKSEGIEKVIQDFRDNGKSKYSELNQLLRGPWLGTALEIRPFGISSDLKIIEKCLELL